MNKPEYPHPMDLGEGTRNLRRCDRGLAFDVNDYDEDNYTPLMWASSNARNDLLLKLLAFDHIDVDKLGGKNNSSALSMTAETRNLEGMKLLVEVGDANINIPNGFGSTALMIATEKGFEEIVSYLLSIGVNILIQNQLGYTALHLAIEVNNIQIVVLLCEHAKLMTNKVFSEIRNQTGKTALLLACECGRFAIAKLLIEKYNADIDAVTQRGMSSLMKATAKGFEDIVELLLHHNANIHLESNIDGSCALMLAFEYRGTLIPKMLLEKGANRRHLNQGAVTVTMKAAEKGNLECVKLLFDDVKLSASSGSSAPAILVPHYARKRCMNCNEPFSFLLPKHHCHVCGELLCFRCCPEASPRGHTRFAVQKKYLEEESLGKEFWSKIANSLSTYFKLPVLDKFSFGRKSRGTRNEQSHAHRAGGSKQLWKKVSLAVNASKAFNPLKSTFRECLRCKNLSGESMRRKVKLNMQSTDGSTALHFAAKNGNIEVYMFLLGLGCDDSIKNNAGETAPDLLAAYDTRHDEAFYEKYVKAVKEGSIAPRTTMLSPLSPLLRGSVSPNAILNSIFSVLLHSIRTDDNLVYCLVMIATGIIAAMKMHPLEKPYLKDRLDTVSKMVDICFNSHELDVEANVIKVLLTEKSRVLDIRKPLCFKEGVLKACIEHEFLPYSATRQVSLLADNVFYKCVRGQQEHRIIHFKDIFQMRSNVISWRTCPAFMFFSKGLSKLTVLSSVTYMCLSRTNSDASVFLIVLCLIGIVLRDIGLSYRAGWSLEKHFNDIWNYLEAMSILLLSSWMVLLLDERQQLRAREQSSTNQHYRDDRGYYFSTAKQPSENFSEILLAAAAVPLSLLLLKYVSINKELGQYVLTVIAMFQDLRMFAVVYLFFVIGFGIAFHSLFPTTGSFDTLGHSFTTLFSASLGEFHFEDFVEHSYTQRFVGESLMFIFVTIAMVVLVNLVVSRMSSTHDAVSAEALSKWCLMKVAIVQEFLLIEESSALTMLPAPLNIITTLLYPLHWLVIWFAKNRFYRDLHTRLDSSSKLTKSDEPFKCISVSGTAADVIICALFILPCALYEIYLSYLAIRSQKVSSTFLYGYIAFVILFFPIVYLSFIVVLFVAMVRTQSTLKLSKKGECIVDYDEIKEHHPHTCSSPIEKGKSYDCVEVAIVRAELNARSFLSDPKAYVIFSHTGGMLVTDAVAAVGVRPCYSFQHAKKRFIFPVNLAESSSSLMAQISLVDGHSDEVIASLTVSTAKWISNGRFEGNLELKYPGWTTVAGTITISMKKIELSDEMIEVEILRYEKAHDLEHRRSEIRHEQDMKPVKFTEGDIEEIFQGIREKESVYPKSPFAYESHVDLRRQLTELREEFTKTLREQTSQLRDHVTRSVESMQSQQLSLVAPAPVEKPATVPVPTKSDTAPAPVEKPATVPVPTKSDTAPAPVEKPATVPVPTKSITVKGLVTTNQNTRKLTMVHS